MTSPTNPIAVHNMQQGTNIDGRVKNNGGITVSRPCVGFSCFLGFGLTLMGAFMTGFAYNDPFQNDAFFAKFPNPMRTVGPIFLGFGIFFIIVSIFLYSIFASNRVQHIQQFSGPAQPDVNIYIPPPIQGSSQPYPPQPGYQHMEDKAFSDPPPPYFASSGQSAPPGEPPIPTQPAYNPSGYGTH